LSETINLFSVKCSMLGGGGGGCNF
jgi:hypothetical protein